jgi:hypothetical protein
MPVVMPLPGRKGCAVALVAYALLGPVDPVAAQQKTPSPSASELWEEFPLDPSPTPAAADPRDPVKDERRVRPARASSDGGDGLSAPLLLGGLAVVLATIVMIWTFRSSRGGRTGAPEGRAPVRDRRAAPPGDGRRGRAANRVMRIPEAPARPLGAPPPDPPARPLGASPPDPPARPLEPLPPDPPARPLERLRPDPPARPLEPLRPDPPPRPREALPPDPRRAWTAEVEWAGSGATARFSVIARTGPEGDGSVIAESPPLEWPPTSPTAFQALTGAVNDLERVVLAAGWTPLPPGSGWYAKRYAWSAVVPEVRAPVTAPADEPVPAQPEDADPERTGRFRRRGGWPEECEGMWRCELRWDAGMVNSRFEAVAYPPGERRGRVVGASGTFKWLIKADPDPAAREYRKELARLVAALQRAGWERVGAGAKWYSARFVWRRSGTPPPDLESRAHAAGDAR